MDTLDISDFYFEKIHKHLVLRLRKEEDAVVIFYVDSPNYNYNYNYKLEFISFLKECDLSSFKRVCGTTKIYLFEIKGEHNLKRDFGYSAFVKGMEYKFRELKYTNDEDTLRTIMMNTRHDIDNSAFHVPPSIITKVKNLRVHLDRGGKLKCAFKHCLILVNSTLEEPSFPANDRFYGLYKSYRECLSERSEFNKADDNYYEECNCELFGHKCKKDAGFMHYPINKDSIDSKMLEQYFGELTPEYILFVNNNKVIHNISLIKDYVPDIDTEE